VILTIRHHTEIARATGDAGAGAVLAMVALAAAACVATVFVTRFGGLDRLRLSPKTSRVVTPVALVLAVLVVGVGGHTQISDAWNSFRNERTVNTGDDPSSRLTSFGGTRYDVWQSAVDAFQAEPVSGIGPGTFEFYWSREGKNAEFLRDGHSLYLETFAEFGLFGGLGLLTVIAALLAGAWAARGRIRRRVRGADANLGAIGACAAVFVVLLFSAGIDWMWEVPALGTLALGSIAVATTAGFARWGNDPVPRAPRIAIVAVALVAAAIQVPGLVSTQRLRASAEQLRSGDKTRAVELADESVSAEPWAAAP
jgi:O-antigen ligase